MCVSKKGGASMQLLVHISGTVHFMKTISTTMHLTYQISSRNEFVLNGEIAMIRFGYLQVSLGIYMSRSI